MADLKAIGKKINKSLNKRERIEKGYVLTRAIIEIVGKPAEHIKEVLENYIEKIKNDDFYDVESHEIDEPEETEDKGIYSTYAEIIFWSTDMSKLTGFCFDYMPSSIEIIEPNKMIVETNDMTDLFNDLQNRLHTADMLAKTLHSENKRYAMSMSAIVKNLILLGLSMGPKKIEDLVKLSGIEKDALQKFVDKVIEDKIIIADNGVYTLPKNKK